jgi:hypothetical protein
VEVQRIDSGASGTRRLLMKYYEFDTDELDYGQIYGSYRDQYSMRVTFREEEQNARGGDFKIPPMQVVNFLKSIGCKLHFVTDRKHSYLHKIELKPWSEFEQEIRRRSTKVDSKKKDSKIKK